MGILVVDQSPDLFWFVSGALREDEIPLKHLPSMAVGEHMILQDMPEIVVMSGDDGADKVTAFISRMRNHVFARNTIFIVFTSNSDPVEKRNYLISGAGFVLFRSTGQMPSPKFFRGLVKWFMTLKAPEQQLFEYKPVPFKSEAELTTYGRIGWISPSHVMLETNIALEPGETIDVNCPLFEELEIKDAKVQCVEKNKAGRYYQYSNSLLCKWGSKNFERDQKTMTNWIKANNKSSKNKSVKIVFFEPEFEERKHIRGMVKADSRFCARGYHNIDDFADILAYQQPQLVLINRSLISKDKNKFEAIKKYVTGNFCFCVTYSEDPVFGPEEFKKQYEFAMHINLPVTIELLEGMISKLQMKFLANHPEFEEEEKKKLYLSKNSVNSRITFTAPCALTELHDTAVGVNIPFTLSNFCGVEITAHPFAVAKLPRNQFFRIFFSKKASGSGVYHRAMLVGQNFKETESIIENMNLITTFGYDKWLVGDTLDPKAEKKKP
jgi:hypothetical protein